MYRQLESAIERYYSQHGILSPHDIDLEALASEHGIIVRYLPRPSKTYELKGGRHIIIIDSRNDRLQQRVELAHELGHVLLHTGTQWRLPKLFRIKQEWQAERFAMYALAPTFMLLPRIDEGMDRRTLSGLLAEEFGVPQTFMSRRLAILHAQLEYQQSRSKFQVAESRNRYEYAVWFTILLSAAASLAAC